jgi:hypothetical protein
MRPKNINGRTGIRGLRENRIPVTIEESRQKKARLLL